MIPEAQHRETPASQPCVAPFVMRGVRMLAAIHFDDEAQRRAAKVHDVGVEWHLAAEAMTLELPVADSPPKPLLGICHVAAQLTRSKDRHRMRLAAGAAIKPPPPNPPP